jgi:hypothetical protein
MHAFIENVQKTFAKNLRIRLYLQNFPVPNVFLLFFRKIRAFLNHPTWRRWSRSGMGLKTVLSTKNTGKILRKRSQIMSSLHFGSDEAQNGKKEVWPGKVKYEEIFPNKNREDFRAFYLILLWFLTHEDKFLKSFHRLPHLNLFRPWQWYYAIL